MNLIAGQRCPIAHCGGTIVLDQGCHDPRLVCVLCALQQDKYTGNPIPLPPGRSVSRIDKPVHRNGDYQPWRQRERTLAARDRTCAMTHI